RWFVLVILVLSSASYADTWRWVDENGVVNFSDQPHPGAERVDLRAVQTYTAPDWAQNRASRQRDDADDESAAAADTSVTILRPQSDETLWNLEGSLDVLVDVQPAAGPNAKMVFYLDGDRIAGAGGAGASYLITQVYRGTHTLRAALETQNGDQIAISPTVQFHVQETSINNPPGGPGVRPPIARPPVVRPTPRSGR
ncbi:MAG: DUF4124 domain-containing protein, partial [Gammaproteobacteria bacterium]